MGLVLGCTKHEIQKLVDALNFTNEGNEIQNIKAQLEEILSRLGKEDKKDGAEGNVETRTKILEAQSAIFNCDEKLQSLEDGINSANTKLDNIQARLNENPNKSLLEKIKEELEEYSSDEDEDYEDVESININNPHIVPDDELNNFKRMDKSQISSLNETDQEFISKFYNYSDTWDSWEPETPLEKILKSSINSSNNIY